MFIGHFAVGFAAKRVAPMLPLWLLVLAPLWLDILWPVFLALGLETVRIVPGDTVVTPLDLHDYPYSHSLVMAGVWSLLFAGGYALRNRRHVAVERGALVLGLGVFSHWVLDFVTHRPDMPLYPGSNVYVGLGLWNSRAGTMLVEISMFVAAVWIYSRVTRATSKVGTWALAAFVGVLGIMYVGDMFGPPPPSVEAIIAASFVLWLVFPWMAWIDRHRGRRERAA